MAQNFNKGLVVGCIAVMAIGENAAFAQEIGPASDTASYVINSAALILAGLGALLFVVSKGLRDVGLSRIQHGTAVCLRTIGLLSAGAVSFWLVGYNLIATVEPGGLLGEFKPWRPEDLDPMTTGVASGAIWFQLAMLAAIPAAIVSSAVSERVRLWSFVIFSAAISGVMFPIVAAWVWGGGYLAEAWRFYDFAGAGSIHMVGGAAALAAAIIVGPRPGRFFEGGHRPPPSTALPLAAFAAGLILISWFPVLVGAGGAAADLEAAITIGVVSVNTIIGVAAAILAALMITQFIYKRAGLVTGSSAAIAGLVALAADPLHPEMWQAAMIGAVAGVIVTVAPPFLDRFRIDDAGFVIPAHFLCGAWGVIIVPWSNPDAGFIGQFVGVVVIAGFSILMSGLVWVALKYSIGVRIQLAEDGQVTASGENFLEDVATG